MTLVINDLSIRPNTACIQVCVHCKMYIPTFCMLSRNDFVTSHLIERVYIAKYQILFFKVRFHFILFRVLSFTLSYMSALNGELRGCCFNATYIKRVLAVGALKC